MKQISVPRTLAPAPRFTLWVPVFLAVQLCALWLILLAMI
jgi:hypothetical protein